MPPNIIILACHHISMSICIRGLGIQDAREAFEGGERLFQSVMITAASLESFRKVDLASRLRDGSIEMSD